MAVQVAKLIGGAGTGKTRELMNVLDGVLKKIGDPQLVGYCSYTRAACDEAAMRAADMLNVPRGQLRDHGWFKTLHGIAYRCLSIGDELLSNRKADRQWHENALGCRVQGMRDFDTENDDGDVYEDTANEASRALALWSLSRNRLEPFRTTWEKVIEFDMNCPDYNNCVDVIQRFEQAKRIDHRVDFTDILAMFAGWKFTVDGPVKCDPDGDVPKLEAIILDEAQDQSKLLDACFQRLVGQDSVKWVYLAGDPFQEVFGWSGGDRNIFINHPANKTRVMPKSHRCPSEILSVGEEILSECSDYWNRGIEPRCSGGVVDEDVLESDDWLELINPADSWMILARTNYHVGRLTAKLRENAIPWLPLRKDGGSPWKCPARQDVVSALWGLETGGWVDGKDWQKIVASLDTTGDGAGLLERGTKSRWSQMEPNEAERVSSWATLDALPDEFGATAELVEEIKTGRWKGRVKGAGELIVASNRWGWEQVTHPGVRVGTIHCSPPEEPVLTTNRGYVPISKLIKGFDRLVGYHSKTNCIFSGKNGRNGKRGYDFNLATRLHCGKMLIITTDSSTTRVTPDHRVRARFTKETAGKYLVYLMKRGNWWRVGRTQTFQIPYRSGGVSGRIATEKADAAWILKICDTLKDAILSEAWFAGHYGIPTITFENTRTQAHFSSGDIQSVHESIKTKVYERVKILMDELGLLEEYPLFDRSSCSKFKRLDKTFELRAANLIPGYMEVPVHGKVIKKNRSRHGRRKDSEYRVKPTMKQFSVTKIPYDGPVYSLDVIPHEHYISGGLVVHNSSKGMEAENVILLESSSRAAAMSCVEDEGRDSEARVAYVGVTRARERLIVLRERYKYRMRIET